MEIGGVTTPLYFQINRLKSMSEEEVTPVSLESLLVPDKVVSMEYPGKEGFEIDLCYLGRDSLLKLREKCLKKTFGKGRVIEETFDNELFIKVYSEAVIKGWRGLIIIYVEELLLVDVSALNPDSYMVFNSNNAYTLLKNSAEFDDWLSEVITDLSNFSSSK